MLKRSEPAMPNGDEGSTLITSIPVWPTAQNTEN